MCVCGGWLGGGGGERKLHMMLVILMTDNDYFDDRSDGDGGDDGGDGDGVMRKCAAEDLGPHMCVCVPALLRWERGSGRRVEETQDYQLGTQLLLGWHKWAHNSTHGGTNRQTAVAQVGTQH